MLQLQRRLSHWRDALRALGGGGRRSAGTVLVSQAKCRLLFKKLIRENELREEKKRQASATTSEGSTSYAYQSGDTVHGKLDASKIQQQEELTETGGFEDPTAGGAHRDPSAGQDKPLPSLQVWSSSTSRCVGEPHGDNVWRSARSDHTVSSQSGQS